MRKNVLALLFCALLFVGCTQQKADFPTVAEAAQRPPDIRIAQETSYIPQGQQEATLESMAAYRPFPGKYDAKELHKALSALPQMRYETPESGEEKIYLKEEYEFGGYWGEGYLPGYLTGGTISKAELDALIGELNRAQEARPLAEVLAPYGLTFRAMGKGVRDAITLPTLTEAEASGKIIAALEKLGHGVLYLTIDHLGEYGDERLHLVFCKAGEGYRFAAMDRVVDSGRGEHSAITAGDLLYFECDCEDAWGTGESCRLAKLFPLREGAYEYLAYPRERVDAHFAIETLEAMRLTGAETTANGGAHFMLECAFRYESVAMEYLHIDGLEYADFADTFKGSFTFHVFDDNDGKGMYTYAPDIGPRLSFARSEALREALRQRVALLLRAEDEAACWIGETMLEELNLEIEGYPYMTSSVLSARQAALPARAYMPQQNNGQRCYMEDAEQLPAASGTLAATDIPALTEALEEADIAAALQAAGLRLPDGFALPGAGPAEGPRNTVLRYENGDALVLEARIPKRREGERYTTLYLLFLRQGESYDFTTAYKRFAYTEPEPAVPARIFQAGPAYYLHGEDWNEWIIFTPGGGAASFRLSGGCALGNLPGAPVEYILEFVNAFAGENGALLCDVTVHYSYENYPVRLRFDLPLRLINEGDGRGFYSLDTNSQYFFGDILSVPYVRDIFSERLTLQAQSADRLARSAALECLRALAMD